MQYGIGMALDWRSIKTKRSPLNAVWNQNGVRMVLDWRSIKTKSSLLNSIWNWNGVRLVQYKNRKE